MSTDVVNFWPPKSSFTNCVMGARTTSRSFCPSLPLTARSPLPDAAVAVPGAADAEVDAEAATFFVTPGEFSDGGLFIALSRPEADPRLFF